MISFPAYCPQFGQMVCGRRGLPQFLQISVATEASFIAAFRFPPRLVEWRRFGSGVIVSLERRYLFYSD